MIELAQQTQLDVRCIDNRLLFRRNANGMWIRCPKCHQDRFFTWQELQSPTPLTCQTRVIKEAHLI